jgi:outer membrane receptor protein involved in Fe transport
MAINNRNRNTLALAVKTLAGVAVTAWAAQASAQSLQLEEVLVTAQKRSESLQDVPIAVTAISGDKIAEAGLQNMQDLTDYVPNVVMISSPGGGNPGRIFIRGIGSGNNAGFEQSVGSFVDGIYAGRARQFLVPFLDVASVEILKGPQGVLFGKNTVAGAMVMNSARPTDDLEGELRAQYEMEYGSTDYNGVVSGALSDNLRGRLAARYQEQEGYMDNIARNTDEPEVENTALRGSLVWDAADNVQVYTKVEYAEQETVGTNMQLTDISGNFRGLIDHEDLLLPQEKGRFDDKNSLNSWNEEGTESDSLNGVLQIDWDLNNLTLTSLTGYSEYESDFVLDGDVSNYRFIEQHTGEDFEQVSQEFRLASPGGETLDYILGVYLESQELNNLVRTDISLIALSAINVPGSPVPPFELGSAPTYSQEADTAAAFAQFTWQLADQWQLAGGLRYSYEEKKASLNFPITDFGSTEQTDDLVVLGVAAQLLNRTPFEIKDDRSTGNVSYSLNLTWDYSDDSMAYLRTARGYKSGGFNPAAISVDPELFEYDDEEVNTIELGSKMTLLDGAATVNLAVFYTEMTDLQVTSFVDSGFIVGNAAESTSKGFEVDTRWQATDFLDFALSVAYLDSTYDDFPGAPCSTTQLGASDPVAAGCEGWTPQNPTGTTNLAGETAGRSPEWTGTFITNLTLPVTDAMFFRGSLDLLYEDELNDKLSPNYQDSYVKVNARLALASSNETWSIALLGKNLTDETTFGSGFGVPFFSGSWAKNRTAPRTVAVELGYRF